MLSLLISIVTTIARPIKPDWSDWIVRVAMQYACPCLGLIAMSLLIQRHRRGLTVAYIAGAMGIVVAAIHGVRLIWEFGSIPRPLVVPLGKLLWLPVLFVLIPAVWNCFYIYAARTFAKK